MEEVRNAGKIPYYIVNGPNGKSRRMYAEELQKIANSTYRIEKIIKRRVENGKKQVLVKWLNYPTTYNSWLNEEDLEGI